MRFRRQFDDRPELDGDVPWTGATVYVIAVIYLLITSAAAVLLMKGRAGADHPAWSNRSLIIIQSAVNIGSLLFTAGLLGLLYGPRSMSPERTREEALQAVQFGLTAGLTAFLVVFPIHLLVVKWFGPSEHPVAQMVRGGITAQVVFLTIISAVVVAPATEELLFRVVLQGWLMKVEARLRRRFQPTGNDGWTDPEHDPAWATPAEPAPSTAPTKPGSFLRRTAFSIAPWIPNVIVSILFAAVHAGPARIPLAFLSLGFGWVYARTRSWLACTVMHAAFNAINTCLLFFIVGWGDLQS